MKFILILFLTVVSACSLNHTDGLENHTLSLHSDNINNSHDKNSSLSKPWTTEQPPSLSEISQAIKNNEANEKIGSMGEWWLYGPGIGYSMLNIGTVIIFPPYALYLVGNAALSLSGYEQIRVTDILPEKPREIVNDSLDGICSVPGRINSSIAGRSYVSDVGIPEKAIIEKDSENEAVQSWN